MIVSIFCQLVYWIALDKFEKSLKFKSLKVSKIWYFLRLLSFQNIAINLFLKVILFLLTSKKDLKLTSFTIFQV